MRSLGTEQGGYALGSVSTSPESLRFQRFITSELKILVVFQFDIPKGEKSVREGRSVCTGSSAFSDFELLSLVNKNFVRLRVKL